MAKFDPSEKALQRMEEIISRFKAGDLSTVREIALIEMDPEAPAAKWTFNNRWLAFLQCHSLDCRTFGAWKALGRFPVKGSRAVYIWEPFQVWAREKDGSWKMEVGLDGVEQHVVAATRFFLSPRFAYHDTEGEDIPHYSHQVKEPPPLLDVAHTLGIGVRYGPSPGVGGSTKSDGSQIALFTDDPHVFFHELAHAAHARVSDKLKRGQRADKETVAEFVACVLAALYGHDDLTGNAWQYIQAYNADPVQAVQAAMVEAQQVIGLIELVARGEPLPELAKEKEV